ncbi:phosphoprotein ECPP44-like [Aristolochia californica]|uniref:phosphoprotein ECPP44-like n=1 Tax=Aristolochia californica TaxID=171875 RepID=UPI0035DCEFB0
MADEQRQEAPVEATDRGLFDFLKKDDVEKKEEAAVATDFEKVHVSEPADKKVEEEEKKPGLVEKFTRSNSSSSSSSSDEDGEKKKKKKGLKDKIKGNVSGEKESEAKHEDTSVPIEKIDEPHPQASDEKKGFLEKIKEKIPGGHKKTEGEVVEPVLPVPPVVAHEEEKEKKGLLEKIKEKLPGYHKNGEEKEKPKEETGTY